MLAYIKSYARLLLSAPARILCWHEYKNQDYIHLNERPIEYSFVFRQLSALCPKSVLDVGSGTTALPHLVRNCGVAVTAIDNIVDYWPHGMANRHYHIVNDDIVNTRINKEFELITCISTLEHIVRFDEAVHNMFKLLKPGGHVVLTCPYNADEYIKNVYTLPDSSYGQDFPFVTQSFSRTNLDAWLNDNPAELVDQEWWRCWTGDYWTQGEQVIPPTQVAEVDRHQLTCLLLRRRF